MSESLTLLAVDVDGTLLNSKHELTPTTARALRAAAAAGVTVVLATGKTRHATRNAREALGLRTPGVYAQGLAVYDGEGTLLFEECMTPALVAEAEAFVRAHHCAVVAYSGESLLTLAVGPQTDQFVNYHEPRPVAVPTLVDRPVRKMIILDAPGAARPARPELASQLGARATLVEALPGMVELLPPGASKGRGLQRLLNYLGVDPRQVLAIGDGENDVEMLHLARIGVAMGNAMPQALAAADYVTATNDADGVAQAVDRFLLAG